MQESHAAAGNMTEAEPEEKRCSSRGCMEGDLRAACGPPLAVLARILMVISGGP